MEAYAVNPKWYDIERTNRRPPFQARGAGKGFLAAVKKIYGSIEAFSIHAQFSHFSRG
jgi:hypothetical protein